MGRLSAGFTGFPSGSPGIGLAMLRFTLAIGIVAGGMRELSSALVATAGANAAIGAALGLVRITCGALILTGFRTTLVSALVAIIGAGLLAFQIWPLYLVNLGVTRYDRSLLEIAVAFSLMMLGPGAYSIDARLFGRREIVIPRRKPSSSSSSS